MDKPYLSTPARDPRGRWVSGLDIAVSSALAKSPGIVRAFVGPVRKASLIESITGATVRGFRHSLTNQGVAHTLKAHGSVAAEAARGQIAVLPEDFKAVSTIVRSPDLIVKGSSTGSNQQPRIIFEKTIAGMRYTYIGEIQSGKHRIEMVSLWKKQHRHARCPTA